MRCPVKYKSEVHVSTVCVCACVWVISQVRARLLLLSFCKVYVVGWTTLHDLHSLHIEVEPKFAGTFVTLTLKLKLKLKLACISSLAILGLCFSKV